MQIKDYRKLTFQDISEELQDEGRPWLDRSVVQGMQQLSPLQKQWREEGLVVLPKFLPDLLIAAYSEVRERECKSPGGWPDPIPYMRYKELRDIATYQPLMDVMKELLGEDMGLHLCLTGWVSTERKWHQDDYLNPPDVKSNYAAVWMALDDISPHSGPFEFVRGSNRWPLIRREKLFEYLRPEERASADWPTMTQDWVARACEEEMAKRGAKSEKFIAKKGDVLIWHGCLIHQGSRPEVKNAMRKALICHYSAITKRPDMPAPVRHNGQGHYFPIGAISG